MVCFPVENMLSLFSSRLLCRRFLGLSSQPGLQSSFLFFSPPTLLKYRVAQQQWKTCWIISLHFKNALELLGIIACDVGLFSFTCHCSVFYEPELESDIIINSVSSGLLQYWLSCFTLTVWETLHFSSGVETHFVQYLERKEKYTSFVAKAQCFVCVEGRCY